MPTPASAEILHALHCAIDRHQMSIKTNQLDSRVTEWLGCPVLYLDKPQWHNRGEVAIPGEIFFSIWVGEKGRLKYNIHALKLRHLTAYRLESRKFAEAFRVQFDASGWPNVSTAFGPQTLMQGWIPFDATRLDDDLDSLILQFVGMHQSIGDLLDR